MSDPSMLTLLAPLSGVLVPLEAVPDEAFSQRLVGDGVAVDPLSDTVLAPADARVLQVHRAKHAITLDVRGLEIVIHVGLDTVKIDGAGLRPLVTAGQFVKAGEPLLRFEPDVVGRRAVSLITPMIIANMELVERVFPATGRVEAGRDAMLRVRLKQATVTAVAVGGRPAAGQVDPAVLGPAIRSEPVTIADPTGLHARPAAALAATAKRFAADLRLEKGEREANLRSLVSIMALEVSGGETVTVVARGVDAVEAVTALVALLRHSGAGSGEAGFARPVGAGVMRAGVVRADVVRASKARAAATRSRGASADGTLTGVPASAGVAVGQVVHLRYDDEVPRERGTDANAERRALDAAIAAAHLQLETLRKRLTDDGEGDRAGIFAAHQELLEDPELLDAAASDVRAGWTAAWAWRQLYVAQAERVRALRDPLLSARATDLRDVGRRVLHLLVGRDESRRDLPPDAIVIAEDLTPSDAASLDRTRVRGLCTTMGSATSHVAILARGLGLPAVAGMDPLVLGLAEGTRVILDGDAGTIRSAPTADEERLISMRQAAAVRQRETDVANALQPATTRDGHRIEVAANLGDVRDAVRVPTLGAEGVGLLRSEFLFQDRHEAPEEDEQTALYSEAARALGPERLLVIRTLDVGGDKPLPYLPMEHEENPFLGERGVRFTLTQPELFRTQVRAILRASREGKVAIMFPMIATLGEWRESKALVERERLALGVPPIPVGIMVETAAAALMAERFAREADFLSLGTNDLTQYTLAMDRTNPRLAPQVDALDPSVLTLIAMTVAGATQHGRWVGVCGALAGDQAAVPVLLGLGVHELSVDLPLVPQVKARVRTLSYADCRTTATEALACGDAAEVRALVARRHGGTT